MLYADPIANERQAMNRYALTNAYGYAIQISMMWDFMATEANAAFERSGSPLRWKISY